MLKKIIIKNICSIKECEIDFQKAGYSFASENIVKDIVNPVAIYGHNGSGKSSVMKAMGFLIQLMSEPVQLLHPFNVNDFLSRKYNETKNESFITGSIDLYFELNKKNYIYHIQTALNKGITREYLCIDDKKYFDRQEMNVFINDKQITLKKERTSQLIPYLRLSAASDINNKIIQDVYSYISSFIMIYTPNFNSRDFITSSLFKNINLLDLIVNKSNEVKSILSKYNDFPLYTIKKKDNPLMPPTYQLQLQDGDFEGELNLSYISTGMLSQSVLLSLVLSLPKNAVLFVDELDFALHPETIKSFLDVIRDKKIQLVFTSHNTNVMQSLRPDQLYFANWKKGFSTYKRLSKIYPNIREVNNIEKMYLSSIFDEEIESDE